MYDKETIRNRIIDYRVKRGLKPAELARRAGIAPSAVSLIENGERLPSVPVLGKIAEALSVTLDFLSGKTTESLEETLLQDEGYVVFFRNFRELPIADQEVIKKQVEFMKGYRSKPGG